MSKKILIFAFAFRNFGKGSTIVRNQGKETQNEARKGANTLDLAKKTNLV